MQLLRGVVVESARRRQTIVSDSASVAPLSSHEIWLRQADGQELPVTLDTNTVHLHAGQALSVLGRQHRGAFQPFMVINEATGAVIQIIAAARWGLCGLMGQLYGLLCLLPLLVSFPFVLVYGSWSKFALCLAAAILLFVPSWLRARQHAARVTAYVSAHPQALRAAV